MPPLRREELEALRQIPTPTICNALETFSVRPRNKGFMDGTIVCRFPELGPVVGYAVTAKIRASRPATEQQLSHEEAWAEFEKVPQPWVVVIEDLDHPTPVGSYWGEVNAAVYKALGAVGAVTNGGVRDLTEARSLGFHFFSSCILVSHAHVHLVEVGCPVSVGGLSVRPGNLLHGDGHGVTSIPLEVARELPRAAREIAEAERRLIEYASSPECIREGLIRMYGDVD